MAHGEETFEFTYHIRSHEGKGSVQFMSKPAGSDPTEDGWKTGLLQAICQQIAKQERAYVVEAVPFSDKKDRASEPDHFAFLHIDIDKLPGLTYNPDHYVVKTRE